MLIAISILWAVLVLVRYFEVPQELVHLYEGELLPAAHWRESLGRAAAGFAGAMLVVLAAYATGRLVVAVARMRHVFRNVAESTSFELAIGFTALSTACLALAGVGAYRPAVVRTIIGAIGVIALVRGARGARHLRFSRRKLDIDRVEVPFLILAGLAVAGGLVGAVAPEIEYDALWYHLWLPHRWFAAGRPVDLVHEYPSLYPLSWQLLYGAAMTVGGPVAAKLLHFICLPLIGWAAAMLAAEISTSRVARSAAAAVAVVSPTMLWEATTAYVDLALAWYVTLAVYGLVRYVRTQRVAWLVLSGVMLGMSASIKHLALMACFSAGLVLLFVEWKRRGWRSALRSIAVLALVTLLLPLPWYARAYASSGNPVVPDMYRVFGAQPPERWNDVTERGLDGFKSRFGRERTVAHLLALPWDVTMHGARYRGTAGPLFLILVPVGLLAGGLARALLAGCAIYIVLWASPISSFQFRFLVPILPVLACVGAAGFARLPRVAALAIVLPAMCLNLPPFMAWHDRQREESADYLVHVVRTLPIGVVIGSESSDEYLRRQVRSYAAWRFINDNLPERARVLTFSGGDHLYSRRDRLWSDSAAARPATWDQGRGDEAEAHRALGALRITHVLIDKRQASFGDAQRLAITSDAMRACCLDPLYDDDRFVVYRVR